MKLHGKKKPLRKPDGRPEFRTPEQILKDAASDISSDLPTKGRKIGLEAYFRSGNEHRVAHRLLKDNGVLPQHLQDLKDAEDGQMAAQEGLRSSIEKIESLLPNIQACRTVLSQFKGEAPLPSVFLDKTPDDPLGSPEIKEIRKAFDQFVELSRLLNQRHRDALASYRDALASANEATERYNKQIAATGQLLPVYKTSTAININHALREAENCLPEPISFDREDLDAADAAISGESSLLGRLSTLW